jgi:hypothetical protein
VSTEALPPASIYRAHFKTDRRDWVTTVPPFFPPARGLSVQRSVHLHEAYEYNGDVRWGLFWVLPNSKVEQTPNRASFAVSVCRGVRRFFFLFSGLGPSEGRELDVGPGSSEGRELDVGPGPSEGRELDVGPGSSEGRELDVGGRRHEVGSVRALRRRSGDPQGPHAREAHGGAHHLDGEAARVQLPQ